jgi:hypothetical protein
MSFADGAQFNMTGAKGVIIRCDTSLPLMVGRIGNHVLFVSEATYDALIDDYDLETQFLDEVDQLFPAWKDGPVVRALVQDGGSFAEASRRRADKEAVFAQQGLERFVAEVDHLVSQIAEMRERPTAQQVGNFGERLGQLDDRASVLEAQLRTARAKLEFANVALIDTSDLKARA